MKTLRSQKLRTLLTHRKLPQSKVIAIENDLRGTLRDFISTSEWWGRRSSRHASRSLSRPPDLAVLVEPLLLVRRVLREQIIILHRRLLAIVRDDEHREDAPHQKLT